MSVFVNWVLACELEFAVVCDVAGIADVERIEGSEDFAVEHLHHFEPWFNTEILCLLFVDAHCADDAGAGLWIRVFVVVLSVDEEWVEEALGEGCEEARVLHEVDWTANDETVGLDNLFKDWGQCVLDVAFLWAAVCGFASHAAVASGECDLVEVDKFCLSADRLCALEGLAKDGGCVEVGAAGIHGNNLLEHL